MFRTVSEIKKLYLDYFQSKQHTIVKSSSLIPVGDPTLLFTTAGMVQFKPMFTGAVELPYTRAASAQKCLRTTDLENVGKTDRHCTFFEMLGNFSFGDYFKKEAIEYALDFSVNVLKFPIEKIWITVYLDDEEAIDLWVHAGIPRERIVKLGKADNFWGPAGDSGACGPCSELYLDRGVEHANPDCGTKNDCKPGCSCDRFLEFWNLVFNQFNQDRDGVLHPLKQTGIDTGSGLERVALLLQNVNSVYDTDQLRRIIQKIEVLTGIKYDSENRAAFRVLTDHSRSITFAISDGILPDRTGRGYVIRRIIRRASLFARKLQQKEPFLYKLIPEVVEIYREEYPGILESSERIKKIVYSEEKLFLHTLEVGLGLLEEMKREVSGNGGRVLSGKDIFKLYGTYGFPVEMTRELLEESGLSFDEEEFERELEKDRTLSRESWKGKKISYFGGDQSLPQTRFTGYTDTSGRGKVLYLGKDQKQVEFLNPGDEGILVLDESSFYGEAGGQIGDTGYLKNESVLFLVQDTQKENDIIIHVGRVLKGRIVTGITLDTEVDVERRKLLTYHHSGTHLLHGALRRVLGNHVSQKASLVSNEYLRFDFSHPEQLGEEEIQKIEDDVNHAIRSGSAVNVDVFGIEEAKRTGALFFFDDKYGERVRVVRMGEFSAEFCGGCHVNSTGEIENFMIFKESSPGAGNRRIEALCGSKVPEFFQTEFQILKNSVNEFNLKAKEITGNSNLFIQTEIPSPEEINSYFLKQKSEAVSQFRQRKKEISRELAMGREKLHREKKKLEEMAGRKVLSLFDEISNDFREVSQLKLFHKIFIESPIEGLKELGDSLKNRYPESVIFFVNSGNDTDTILIMAGRVAISQKVHSGELLKKISILLGGRGGGKPELAQGSSREKNRYGEALEMVLNELKKE